MSVIYIVFENINKKDEGKMKRLISLIILYSSFLLLCPRIEAQWEGAQVQRLTSNHVSDGLTGLYIDTTDKLYLFYTQQIQHIDTSITLFYTTRTKGEDWAEPVNLDLPPCISNTLTKRLIKFDPRTSIIHIAFIPKPGSNLYYTNNQQPNWGFSLVDSLTEGEFTGLNMAFDTLGTVNLVWNLEYDSIGSDSIGYNWLKVIYANNSIGSWIKKRVSPSMWLGYSGSGTFPVPLCVEKNGSAHILYQNWQDYWYHTFNDSLGSTIWSTDSVLFPPGWQSGGPTSFAVDKNDNLHMCLWGGTWPSEPVSYILYYYRSKGSSTWGIPDTLTSTGIFEYLFIDKCETPQLTWQRTSGTMVSNDIIFAKRNQDLWSSSKILDEEPYYPTGFQFVIDSGEKGHGAFTGWRTFESDSTEIFYIESSSSISEESQAEKTGVNKFDLFQNYPNPFNEVTTIRYRLNTSKTCQVTIRIYNVLGKEVRELLNSKQTRGNYEVLWDGKDSLGKEVSSGIYFYELKIALNKSIKKLVLLK
jgi:hypothetical protein